MEHTPKKNNKAKGGRKPKPDAEKAIYKVGGFWLTKLEKETYDKKYDASGLNNQTEFFRRMLFGGSLKLYYKDIHSEKIYIELLKIEKEIQKIGANYNQVVKRIHSLHMDTGLFAPINELVELTLEMNNRFDQLLCLFEPLASGSTLPTQSPSTGESC